MLAVTGTSRRVTELGFLVGGLGAIIIIVAGTLASRAMRTHLHERSAPSSS